MPIISNFLFTRISLSKVVDEDSSYDSDTDLVNSPHQNVSRNVSETLAQELQDDSNSVSFFFLIPSSLPDLIKVCCCVFFFFLLFSRTLMNITLTNGYLGELSTISGICTKIRVLGKIGTAGIRTFGEPNEQRTLSRVDKVRHTTRI